MGFNQAANTAANNEGKFAQLLQQVDELAQVEGIRQIDLLALAAPLDSIFNTITRQGAMTSGDLARNLDLSLHQVEIFVELLVGKGYLTKADPQVDKITGYKIRFVPQKKRASSKVWDSLDF